MSLGFGWKARIGHLYPSGGLCDYEPQIMAPPGVQFLTTRLTFRKSELGENAALVQDIERHAQLVADARVDLIAFNCTSASLLAGPAAINRRITAATRTPSTTTIDAIMTALKAARLRRLALLTPYATEIVEAEIAFLTANGFSVVEKAGIPCRDPIEQGSISPDRWMELARTLRRKDVDGLLFSCAGIQLATVLGTIEAEFGRPVIGSNQALVWHCLRLLGLPDRPEGYGALLEGAFDDRAQPIG